jgi:deoxyinosine 3'endonuclease (endonuclease V)
LIERPSAKRARHAHVRPGELYRRELPPLLSVLATVTDPLELVIVDGYV